jgi:hypothetical protein
MKVTIEFIRILVVTLWEQLISATHLSSVCLTSYIIYLYLPRDGYVLFLYTYFTQKKQRRKEEEENNKPKYATVSAFILLSTNISYYSSLVPFRHLHK